MTLDDAMTMQLPALQKGADPLAGFDLGDIGMEGLDFDLGAFDLGDIGGDSGKVGTRYVKPPLYVGERRAPVMYDRAVQLVHDTARAIFEGERVDAVLSGNFIFGDFFEALMVETNAYATDLTLSTLALSPNNVDSFHNLLAGNYLGALNLVVSDYWYAHNREALPYLYDQLDQDDRFQLAVAGVHTKIALLEVEHRKIVIHGSANLRSSRSVEAITIETNPALFDFHRGWHETILSRYGTVQKSVRASALFDLINHQGGSDGERKPGA